LRSAVTFDNHRNADWTVGPDIGPDCTGTCSQPIAAASPPTAAVRRRALSILAVVVALIVAATTNSTQAATQHSVASIASSHALKHAKTSSTHRPPTSQSAQAKLLPDQKIVVHRNAGSDKAVLVSIGIPFPPGMLANTDNVRILDEHGAEVPAAVKTTLKWFFKDGSVRAVRAQFRATLDGDQQTFYFSVDKPRTMNDAGWPYADGLVGGEQGLRVPAAEATLMPEWLCASLIAGPQLPATPDEPYADYVSTQFKWARKLPTEDPSAWLFDRPTALFKAYIRSGRFDYLQAAVLSYRFYMKYIRRDGLPIEPWCAGGWSYGGKPCDVKYVYIEPILLSLALTGDDSEYDTHVVDNMMTEWETGGWNAPPGPYKSPSQYFTERLAGLGLLETVSGYELTGNAQYRSRIDDRIGWLYHHQHDNPDGLGDDGSWRNSWNLHENDSWNPKTDVRGTSPWMTENIIDGLWHAWLVTGDKRIPGMITDFGRYMEHHAWIDPKLLVKPHDWRNPCSGPDGQISWYWSSAHASTTQLLKIQDSEGWYSDGHNVELMLPIATAYYFETDPAQSAALKRRLAALGSSYNTACAEISSTLRRFNWNNRGSGVVQWLVHQPAGAGTLPPTPKHVPD
jgi:hypothetical protein